jgi:hypothetical protein
VLQGTKLWAGDGASCLGLPCCMFISDLCRGHEVLMQEVLNGL